MNSTARPILTKIVATLGPASNHVDIICRLVDEGARVFRINFSHGDFDQFATTLSNLREAEERTNIPIAALGDLSGPKIRVERVIDGGVQLEPGSIVHIQKTDIVAGENIQPGDPITFSCTFDGLIDDAQIGQRLLIDDGNVRLLIVEKNNIGGVEKLVCNVTQGGKVTSKKGINLPDTDINAPSLTAWDHECIAWAVQNRIDYLALSFVRQAADVKALKKLLKDKRWDDDPGIPVIAKIEKPQALDDLEAIVTVSDGVMVARGDLGVEMDLAEVPIIQKNIITMCNDHGKPVIVATQMLQSMIESPMPTRAEASDVANAILDGADAVMLSGETAVGQYPVQTVNAMARIAGACEKHIRATQRSATKPPKRLQQSRYRTAALAHGVAVVVKDLDARCVVTWSQLGGGARYLSQNRLTVPIIAASSNRAALRHMSLLFGVTPVAMELPKSTEQWLTDMCHYILENHFAGDGDAMVIVKGEPLGTPGITNKLRIHYLGDVCRVS